MKRAQSLKSLPDRVLRDFDNQTGLTAIQYEKMAPGRTFCDVVVVKARFVLTPDGIEKTPLPGRIFAADRHRNPDDPGGSSLKEAGDLVLSKPGADLFFTGILRRATPWVSDLVSVGLYGPEGQTLAHYQCIVTGPRVWRHSLWSGWTLSDPQETLSVPIHYELSWGGRRPTKDLPPHQWPAHNVNPSGTGFDFSSWSTSDTPAGPQWACADLLFNSFKTKSLTGLGPVPRFWGTRQGYAGTYDAAWQKSFDAGVPDYPPDFDMRFFQCAHPALQCAKGLVGNEKLVLRGLNSKGMPTVTHLPGKAVVAHLGKYHVPLKVDTVHFDLDSHALQLGWHFALPQQLGIDQLTITLEDV